MGDKPWRLAITLADQLPIPEPRGGTNWGRTAKGSWSAGTPPPRKPKQSKADPSEVGDESPDPKVMDLEEALIA
jgi:hypothetical protein